MNTMTEQWYAYVTPEKEFRLIEGDKMPKNFTNEWFPGTYKYLLIKAKESSIPIQDQGIVFDMIVAYKKDLDIGGPKAGHVYGTFSVPYEIRDKLAILLPDNDEEFKPLESLKKFKDEVDVILKTSMKEEKEDQITRAAKFFAEYFNISESEAIDCHHMTLDCMNKYLQSELTKKNNETRTRNKAT